MQEDGFHPHSTTNIWTHHDTGFLSGHRSWEQKLMHLWRPQPCLSVRALQSSTMTLALLNCRYTFWTFWTLACRFNQLGWICQNPKKCPILGLKHSNVKKSMKLNLTCGKFSVWCSKSQALSTILSMQKPLERPILGTCNKITLEWDFLSC